MPEPTFGFETNSDKAMPTLTAAAGASHDVLSAVFAADPRIHFSTITRRWALEDDAGNEWEYDPFKAVWVQVVSLNLSLRTIMALEN